MAKGRALPNIDLEKVPQDKKREIVNSLMELHSKGVPRTDDEVEARIHDYFEFCGRSAIRPGFEACAVSLGVSRQTFWKWSRGIGCSERRQQIIEEAKTLIIAFVEQATLNGTIFPASGIFLLKNWGQYRDSFAIEPTEVNGGRIPRNSREEMLNENEISEIMEIADGPEPNF